MSDLPDRTPQPSDEDAAPGADGARPTPPGAPREPEVSFGYEEDRTKVHRTAAPGAPGSGDPDVTAFTPAPRERQWGDDAQASRSGEATGTHAAATPAAAPAPAAQSASAAVPRKVSVRNRGRMRRRLGYLRRVRELGYRDLGGLVFELRRAGVDNEVLVSAKVDALYSIDLELHALEHGLRDFRNVEELQEPGVSVCLRCGALHGSDANFCPQCGIRVDQNAKAPTVAEPATVAGTTGSSPAVGAQATGTGRERR